GMHAYKSANANVIGKYHRVGWSKRVSGIANTNAVITANATASAATTFPSITHVRVRRERTSSGATRSIPAIASDIAMKDNAAHSTGMSAIAITAAVALNNARPAPGA